MGLKTPDKPMNAEEFRRFTVECYNESEGDLDKQDGIQCLICKNKGYIQVLEDRYAPYKRCRCMSRRDSLIKAKSSGLGDYLNKTLNDYIVVDDWQGRCKRMVEAYLDRHSHDNTWFIACGQSGCGKTLLGSIIANTLLVKKERAVMYIIWTDFIGKVKRDMMGEKANEVSEAMEKVKNADVLFLDEVIKKHNETDLKYLIEIINYRYSNDKKTIITSERLMTEFLDIDEATFGRAVEKCEGFMINIPKDRKKNYRLREFKL
jgi:DNA replication protein DnaC